MSCCDFGSLVRWLVVSPEGCFTHSADLLLKGIQLSASIHPHRKTRANVRDYLYAAFGFFELNSAMFLEIEKAQQVSPLGFRIQNLSILYCSNGSHPG